MEQSPGGWHRLQRRGRRQEVGSLGCVSTRKSFVWGVLGRVFSPFLNDFLWFLVLVGRLFPFCLVIFYDFSMVSWAVFVGNGLLGLFL